MKGSREFLNGSNLKWIAMITMLIDHMGYLLLGYGVLWVLPESTIREVVSDLLDDALCGAGCLSCLCFFADRRDRAYTGLEAVCVASGDLCFSF